MLQRKRHIQIELCVSRLGLSYVGLVVQNKRSTLSLASLARMILMQRRRVKDFMLRARVVVKTSNMKISGRRLVDYV